MSSRKSKWFSSDKMVKGYDFTHCEQEIVSFNKFVKRGSQYKKILKN